jgi:exodeoxyribonuclease VII large subunit
MTNQIPFSFDVPSVSELTAKLKTLVENNFRDIMVEGEISNVKKSRNGHYYFTVKDHDAQLPCVLWRNTASRLTTELRDGQQVVLGGDIQIYAPHGRYQLIVSLVEQAGVGKLQQKYEELKRKLEQEGLFEESRKKPIPQFPKKIGVITSSAGAAFHDIRSTFEQRWPIATLYLHHASVQGLNAAPELVSAIEWFCNQKETVDILIVGRGGGSLEDLWPFNEEIVARAIVNCPIPVISAVGHEVDFSITDFVADARAATPTQAAVIAAPDINEVRFLIEDYSNEISSILQQKIQGYRDYVDRLAKSHALLVVQEKLRFQNNRLHNVTERLQNRIDRYFHNRRTILQKLSANVDRKNPVMTLQKWRESLTIADERLTNRFERILTAKKTQLTRYHNHLEKVNPKGPLKKGFTRILQNGSWIRTKHSFNPELAAEVEWDDGKVRIDPPDQTQS